MIPPSAVPSNDDIGRFVSLSEDILVGSYNVLECGGKRILRDRGKTVARRDEHTVASIHRVRGDGTEQLGKKLDKRVVGGVTGDIPPTVDEEDDAGVPDLCLSLVVLEGVEIDGDALGRSERAGVEEEGVRLGGGRGDVDAHRQVCREMRWIRLLSAFLYGLGDAGRNECFVKVSTDGRQRVALLLS